MSDDSDEFKVLLKWHFEEGAGRIKASAAAAAKKLARLLALQFQRNGRT
jgi:hypothetical protein